MALLRRLSVFIVALLALAACEPGSTGFVSGSSYSAGVDVSITGLPGGTNAAVAITSWDGTYSRWIKGSGSVDLPEGNYRVVAAGVNAGAYRPTHWVQSFTVPGAPAVSVAYASSNAARYGTTPSECGSTGVLTQAEKDQALGRTNFGRALVGLRPIGYDDGGNAQVQASSLIMAANSALSHQPPSSWDCWSQPGYDGANTSNLYYSSWNASTEYYVDGFIDDDNVAGLGHRRWMLDPFLSNMAYGRVDLPGSSAATLKVIGYAQADLSGTQLDHVAFPKGDVPTSMFGPNSELSFTALDPANKWATVSYSGADITVTNGAGQPMSVSAISTNYEGYGVPNHIQWNVAGLQAGQTYTVSVSNAIVSGQTRSYVYTFSFSS